ncbi:MAG: hypothetical protein EKK68_06155 [Candidatus Competibacteraceae bacterium]|nr:MAG: hypothetical protein EKK68_06155 [Candidatus Competibacteraceae bacterium]
MAGPTATTSDILFGLYDAYYLRAPDLKGYTFWQQGIANGTATVSQMSQDFYNQQYAQSSPPNGLGYAAMTDDAFVKAIYANVLNGSGTDVPAQAEVDYWVNFLKTNTRGDFVATFVTAALTFDTSTIVDPAAKAVAEHRQDTLWNKIAVGKDWLTTLGASTNVSAAAEADQSLLPFDPAFQAGQKIYSGITYNDGTMNSAESFIASIKTNPDPMGAINSATDAQIFGTGGGATYLLTTGIDVATANVFYAPLVTDFGTPNNATLNSADQLTGTGTNPTLNATLNGQPALSPKLSGIETLNFNTTAATTFIASNTTGVKTINQDFAGNANDLTVRQLGVASDFGVSNGAAGSDLVVYYNASVISGTGDVQKITVTNNGSTVAAAGNLNFRSETTGGVETFSVTAVGYNRFTNIASDSTVINAGGTQAGNALRTLNVMGDGSFRVDNELLNVSKIDASANKGGIRLTVDDTIAVDVKGGDGADRINFQGGFNAADKYDGGLGRDTIEVNTTGTLVAGAPISNVEILQLTNVTANAAFNGDSITSIDEVRVSETAAGNSTFTYTLTNLNKVGAATYGVYFEDMVGEAGAITIGVKGAADPGAVNDSLLLKFQSSDGTGVAETTGVITADAIETLTIQVGSDPAALTVAGIAGNTMNSVTITGGSAGQAATFTGVMGTPVTGAALIDGSSFVGNLTVHGGTGSNVVKGGSGADTIDGAGRGAAGTNSDVLTGGSGADTFQMLADASGNSHANAGILPAAITIPTAAQLAQILTITDLNLGGGTAGGRVDVLDPTGAAGIDAVAGGGFTIVNGGAVQTLTGATLNTALNSLVSATGSLGQLGATPGAGLFAWGADTYLVVTTNAAAANAFGAVAGEDMIIRVTGVVGTLDASDFI